MSVTEYGDWNAGRARPRAFPATWGPPLGTRDSEVRAEWVRTSVETHTAAGRQHRLQEVERHGRALDRLVELREKVARLSNP